MIIHSVVIVLAPIIALFIVIKIVRWLKMIVISEMDVNKFNLGQMALIKFGAIFIGFIVVMVLNRVIKAVEYYCHEYDI
jgi:hypothetical protein